MPRATNPDWNRKTEGSWRDNYRGKNGTDGLECMEHSIDKYVVEWLNDFLKLIISTFGYQVN